MNWGIRNRYLREALLEAGFKIKNVKIRKRKKVITVERAVSEVSKIPPDILIMYHQNSESG
jgi:hypothetical protein